MKLKSLVHTALVAVVTLIPTLGTAAERTAVQRAALETEGIELIGQMEDVARDVRYNTDTLFMHSRSIQISKTTHYHHLNQIRQLINEELKPAAERLAQIQAELPEWHQKAIDKLLSSARALAADTNSAFLSLNANPATPVVLNDEYGELVGNIDSHAENLVRTADVANDFANAHRQMSEAGMDVPRQ